MARYCIRPVVVNNCEWAAAFSHVLAESSELSSDEEWFSYSPKLEAAQQLFFKELRNCVFQNGMHGARTQQCV